MKLFFGLTFFLFVLIVMTSMSSEREAAIQDGNEIIESSNPAYLTSLWHLFVDDVLLERKANVERNYKSYTKRASNPVLMEDKPWEGRTSLMYGSVLPNETGNINNLFMGADRHGKLVARRDKLQSDSEASLIGYIDDLLIAMEVVRPDQFMK